MKLMKKENLFLMMNLIIMLLIGLAIIFINNNVIPKEPQDRLFNQVITLENQTNITSVPNSPSYALVDYRADAVNRAGVQVGTVYNIKIKNSYGITGPNDTDGYMEFLVGIDLDDKVYVQIVSLIQSSWTVKGIQYYIHEYYQGVLYTSVPNIPIYDAADPTAGATAKDSTGSIKDLVREAIDIHYDLIVEDPYAVLYGEGYIITNDSEFTASEYVKARRIVTNASSEVVGYVYHLSGSGEYFDGSSSSIGIYLAFNADSVVIGVLVPEGEYLHTRGTRYNTIVNYLNTFVGLTLIEFAGAINDGSDITSGVTNTRVLVDILLNAFISEVS
ncbi:hypothetical protein [Peloplasma aerotolerans]|jgi:hypothetical protein|uniref:FMN-binding protein n=1 Tax=Peloplasma aerotolerans TaxID=3044389 RepID=A0AAW6U8F8_9MOLU|nr:hypothetical protein [Mariniplasma sp. M4Ah]MDI6452239.1 hypothetical protein [Mariniplasma sp. M4Ah]MDR4968820.1 hypothetical protein [Acholeplasmataceae bacterium]